MLRKQPFIMVIIIFYLFWKYIQYITIYSTQKIKERTEEPLELDHTFVDYYRFTLPKNEIIIDLSFITY